MELHGSDIVPTRRKISRQNADFCCRILIISLKINSVKSDSAKLALLLFDEHGNSMI